MAVANQICRDAVLALISEAREAGISGLTRTALVKYVYLLDVFCAEEYEGMKRCTPLEWVFLHYGPYSSDLAACLDELEARSFLETEERSSGDKEFAVYKLTDRTPPLRLRDLGLPGDAASRLAHAIREFAYSLPLLLNYVYFKTAPMGDARPKEVLKFDSCRKVKYREEVRPLKLGIPTEQQAKAMRALIEKIKQRNLPSRNSEVLPNMILDSYYFSAIQGGDSDATVETEPLLATLEFPSREGDDRK